MTKKNLNWSVEEAIKDAFTELAGERYDRKKLWVCATAAALMYMEADEETRAIYDAKAMSTSSNMGLEKVMASLKELREEKVNKKRGVR